MIRQGFQPRWIEGKTVERVEMNPFRDGRGSTAHDPRIVFTDGSSVTFLAEETDVAQYGTDICYHPAPKTG